MTTTFHDMRTFDQKILQRIQETAQGIAARVELKDGKYGCYAFSGDWNRNDASMLHRLTVLWNKYQSGVLSDVAAGAAYEKLVS